MWWMKRNFISCNFHIFPDFSWIVFKGNLPRSWIYDSDVCSFQLTFWMEGMRVGKGFWGEFHSQKKRLVGNFNEWWMKVDWPIRGSCGGLIKSLPPTRHRFSQTNSVKSEENSGYLNENLQKLLFLLNLLQILGSLKNIRFLLLCVIRYDRTNSRLFLQATDSLLLTLKFSLPALNFSIPVLKFFHAIQTILR